MTAPIPFDVTGPLPAGTCVIEASAGTGKTWTITALTVRYIAEGRALLEQVMMVTFSRAATSELRHRVHDRLRTTLADLDSHLASGVTPLDKVSALLCEADRPEVVLRRERLAVALASIDAATIATTHEFCQRMLTGLGLLVDHDHTTRFADDVSDLASQVISDVYIGHEVAGDPHPPARLAAYARYREVGQAALNHPEATLYPVDAQGLSADRVGFASEVRTRFEDRKRQAGLYTFDDMVTRLRDALTDPVTGDAAVEALSRRYPIVLIDEFQDTDPTQWQIVEHAFVGQSTLVLIGDPKQAIYAFRGADVNAYLDAVTHATTLYTLPRNHRSDRDVVDAVVDLFAQVQMGDPRIVARPVESAHDVSRIAGPRPAPAVQLRVVRQTGRAPLSSSRAARRVDADLVEQVVGLLSDGWTHDPSRKDEASAPRPLQASDIAVLVRSNWRGEQVRDALTEAGVPAVFGGAQSVMTSSAAQAWLALLRGLTQPSNQTMKRAALGCLIGWSELELAQAVATDDARMSDLAVQMKTLGRVLAQQGVAAVFEALCDQTDLYARLLAQPDGERLLTDVRHMAQLLNDAAVRRELGPAALTAWLADRIEEARRTNDDDRTRRLETDASCVQVMTIHGAKGLEFPVVLLPEAANEYVPDVKVGTPYVVHLDGQRVLDVGVDAKWQLRHRQHELQERDESLRTLYVAMTRAKSRLVMWWAPTASNTSASALHRILNGPRTPGGLLAPDYDLTPDPTQNNSLDPRLVEVVPLEAPAPLHMTSRGGGQERLQARTFTRMIDHQWRRTSYTGLTQEVHSERELPLTLLDDEREPGPDDQSNQRPVAVPSDALVSPLGPLPGGTQFGSLVHGVLEVVDAASPTLDADLASEVARQAARLPVEGLEQKALAAGLADVLHTPLDGLADQISLSDVPRHNWLAELDFELAMGQAGAASTLGDIAAALQDEGLVGDDAFARRYGAHLANSPASTKSLKGFLTGSIDVVLRLGEPRSQRHIVCDYKTNRIPVAGGEHLTTLHYTPSAMSTAMVEAHYPLQALLYCVALHRFLRWRLPGYRPEEHLGGVGYLFVRGMAGPQTPVVDSMRCGVFVWKPTAALVVHVSNLLGGAR